jgi:hypothetical protein
MLDSDRLDSDRFDSDMVDSDHRLDPDMLQVDSDRLREAVGDWHDSDKLPAQKQMA